MRICNKCTLKETMPKITFDSDGICNYCRQSTKVEFKGEPELLRILNSHRRPENKYDCIVALSGGRDSTYTLLKMVKDYKIKVLAVNYANPFTDPIAKKNIENAVKILNVDLISFKFDNHLHEKTFRHNLLVWMKKPDPALIPILCITCKTLYYEILKIANQYDIHCIVTGGNPYETTSFKAELLNVSDTENVENIFIKSLLGIIRATLKNPGYYHPFCIPTLIKGYLFGDPYCIGSRILGRNISRIDMFNYLEWHEDEIIARIRNELNWESPHDLASTWRFDCYVGHIKELFYQKTIGVTERDDLYAKMVREGLLSREDAIRRLEKENAVHLGYLQKLLETAGLNDEESLKMIKNFDLVK